MYRGHRPNCHARSLWGAHGIDCDDEAAMIAVTEMLAQDGQAAVAEHSKWIGTQLFPFGGWQPVHRRSRLRPQERGDGLVDESHVPLVVTKKRPPCHFHRARGDAAGAYKEVPASGRGTHTRGAAQRVRVESSGCAVTDVEANLRRPAGDPRDDVVAVAGVGEGVRAEMAVPQNQHRVALRQKTSQERTRYALAVVHLPESCRAAAEARPITELKVPHPVTRGVHDLRRTGDVSEAQHEVKIAALELCKRRAFHLKLVARGRMHEHRLCNTDECSRQFMGRAS